MAWCRARGHDPIGLLTIDVELLVVRLAVHEATELQCEVELRAAIAGDHLVETSARLRPDIFVRSLDVECDLSETVLEASRGPQLLADEARNLVLRSQQVGFLALECEHGAPLDVPLER